MCARRSSASRIGVRETPSFATSGSSDIRSPGANSPRKSDSRRLKSARAVCDATSDNGRLPEEESSTRRSDLSDILKSPRPAVSTDSESQQNCTACETGFLDSFPGSLALAYNVTRKADIPITKCDGFLDFLVERCLS